MRLCILILDAPTWRPAINRIWAAREQLEIALRIDPHHAPAKLAWAELALGRGEPARAVQAADEVSREDPANPVARLIRASSFLKMAEPEKARGELTALLGMSPPASRVQ
jgi:predicted Zn-dependent protease